MPEVHTHDPIFPERVIPAEYGPDHLPVEVTDEELVAAIGERAQDIFCHSQNLAAAIKLNSQYTSFVPHRAALIESLMHLSRTVEAAQSRGII